MYCSGEICNTLRSATEPSYGYEDGDDDDINDDNDDVADYGGDDDIHNDNDDVEDYGGTT